MSSRASSSSTCSRSPLSETDTRISNPYSGASPRAAQNEAEAATHDQNSSRRSLFLENLRPECDFTHLYQFFSSFGEVSSVRILRDAKKGVSRGIGYVNFASVADASRAMAQIGGGLIRDPQLAQENSPTAVRLADFDQASRHEDSKVFSIHYVPVDVSVDDLRRLLEPYGELVDCYLVDRSAMRGPVKGSAVEPLDPSVPYRVSVVEFASAAAATRAACSLHRTTPFGPQPLHIKPDVQHVAASAPAGGLPRQSPVPKRAPRNHRSGGDDRSRLQNNMAASIYSFPTASADFASGPTPPLFAHQQNHHQFFVPNLNVVPAPQHHTPYHFSTMLHPDQMGGGIAVPTLAPHDHQYYYPAPMAPLPVGHSGVLASPVGPSIAHSPVFLAPPPSSAFPGGQWITMLPPCDGAPFTMVAAPAENSIPFQPSAHYYYTQQQPSVDSFPAAPPYYRNP